MGGYGMQEQLNLLPITLKFAVLGVVLVAGAMTTCGLMFNAPSKSPVQAYAEVVPLTAMDALRIEADATRSPEVLAKLRTGGSGNAWGDLQAYRKDRLAAFAKGSSPAAINSYEHLKAITDNEGIKVWAMREAEALYLQAAWTRKSV